MIQILIASRDDTHTSAEDDQHIDKLLTDANRTRRCFRSQTKMLKNDDPTQSHFAGRLKLLDTLLTALETEWSSIDRSSSAELSEALTCPSEDEDDSSVDSARPEGKPQLARGRSAPSRPQLMRAPGNIKLARLGAENESSRSLTFVKQVRHGMFRR